MLTLGKILLISSLYISLPFWSHAKPNLEKSVARSIAEALKTMENQSISLASDTNLNSNTENRNNSNLKASISPFLNTSDKIHEITNSSSNLAIDNITESPIPTPTPSTSSPLIHGIVSRLPWNSTIADKHFLPVSAHSNATSVVSSERLPWALDNDTLKTPGNNFTTVSIRPPAPTTKSVTPLTTETTEWLTTSSDSFAGFTPYREETTLQPTVQFTNNSKIVPNTSDPQKENRNTGVVFGAILGAILGASLLSLVGYLLCGKRKTDSFSHQRLYDDRNEPVLRLDNAPEPYDVSFGNSSYYNSTVNDSSMPEGRENARDGIPMDDIPPLRTSVSN